MTKSMAGVVAVPPLASLRRVRNRYTTAPNMARVPINVPIVMPAMAPLERCREPDDAGTFVFCVTGGGDVPGLEDVGAPVARLEEPVLSGNLLRSLSCRRSWIIGASNMAVPRYSVLVEEPLTVNCW